MSILDHAVDVFSWQLKCNIKRKREQEDLPGASGSCKNKQQKKLGVGLESLFETTLYLSQ